MMELVSLRATSEGLQRRLELAEGGARSKVVCCRLLGSVWGAIACPCDELGNPCVMVPSWSHVMCRSR